MMETRFTQFIAAISVDSFPELEFWEAFSHAVRAQLRRRGTLSNPPSYLGYKVQEWGEEGAIDDVVFDCYQFAIVNRLNGLKQQLKVKENIDGLVLRNIKNFILERQRRHDATGYAVFKNLEAGVTLALEDGLLNTADSTETRIRNDTRLHFEEGDSEKPVTTDRMHDAVRVCATWLDRLGDLRRQSVRSRELVVEGLRECRDRGITAFLFKDLADAVKKMVREIEPVGVSQDTAAKQFTEHADGLRAEIDRIVDPDTGYEEVEHQKYRIDRVRQVLARMNKQDETKRRIRLVFDEFVALSIADEELPSQAELARQLNLGTSTLSDYVKVIREAWDAVE